MPPYVPADVLARADLAVVAELWRALADTGADERLTLACFATAIVESEMRNVAFGDKDSLGVFQQRASWGPAADRMDPYRAARAFLADATGRVLPRNPGVTATELAQLVQRSAHPNRYAEAESAARYVIAATRPEGTPMARTTWRGKRFDARTAEMLAEVARLTGPLITPTQGSYGTSVSASAGTHAGGGAVDISVRGMSQAQITSVIRIMRRVGFAAWHRTPNEGPWAAHIHGVAVGCPDLAPAARRQVDALRNGRNGLASNGRDKHAGLKLPVVTWETYRRTNPPPPPPPKPDPDPAPGLPTVYPPAVLKPIPPNSSDPVIKPRGVILHVDAGNAESLHGWFSSEEAKGVESHWHIQRDGGVEQYRGLNREADANLKGNSFVLDGVRWGYLSAETQGLMSGGWTEDQLDSIKALLLWNHQTFGIPLRECDSPTAPGIGYHTMWGAPGPWTGVAGKQCPGPDRIRQFYDVLVPWMATVQPWTYAPRVDTPPGVRTLTARLVGPDVAYVQRILGVIPDEKYGPVTIAAVRRWQEMHGLTIDGIIGLAESWPVLLQSEVDATPDPLP